MRNAASRVARTVFDNIIEVISIIAWNYLHRHGTIEVSKNKIIVMSQDGVHRQSALDIWSLAFGCCIGWGCFVMPGTTFLPLAGTVGTLVAMALSACIMLVIACNYHYMVNRFPDNGGSFTFAK